MAYKSYQHKICNFVRIYVNTDSIFNIREYQLRIKRNVTVLNVTLSYQLKNKIRDIAVIYINNTGEMCKQST